MGLPHPFNSRTTFVIRVLLESPTSGSVRVVTNDLPTSHPISDWVFSFLLESYQSCRIATNSGIDNILGDVVIAELTRHLNHRLGRPDAPWKPPTWIGSKVVLLNPVIIHQPLVTCEFNQRMHNNNQEAATSVSHRHHRENGPDVDLWPLISYSLLAQYLGPTLPRNGVWQLIEIIRQAERSLVHEVIPKMRETRLSRTAVEETLLHAISAVLRQPIPSDVSACKIPDDHPGRIIWM